MPNFERMDIDELEAYREKISAQRVRLKAEFMAAGMELNKKRQDASLRAEFEDLERRKKEVEAKLVSLGG